jgi:anti-sigma regulatory factor (Ser/Thr protein kinase)
MRFLHCPPGGLIAHPHPAHFRSLRYLSQVNNRGISVVVKDEGHGFDTNAVQDPTAPGAIESNHGRGIYLMKALMDEVRFEQSGAVVYMRKKSGNTQPDRPNEL